MSGLSVLRVEGLRSRATTPVGPLFDEVMLAVAAGEQVAIVGAPGAGTTAFLRVVARLEAPAAGRIYFEGREITRLGGGAVQRLRQVFPVISGDPQRAFPPHSVVAEALTEAARLHRLAPGRELAARSTDLAEHFHLSPFLLQRKVSSLSASLRQRVVLGRALALRPRMLAADAVVDCLETSAAGPLLEELTTLCRRQRIALLWTTRDADLARRFADRIFRLQAGRLHAS